MNRLHISKRIHLTHLSRLAHIMHSLRAQTICTPNLPTLTLSPTLTTPQHPTLTRTPTVPSLPPRIPTTTTHRPVWAEVKQALHLVVRHFIEIQILEVQTPLRRQVGHLAIICMISSGR